MKKAIAVVLLVLVFAYKPEWVKSAINVASAAVRNAVATMK